jgi:hypothetical protein
VFERFSQASPSTSGSRSGLGLGMAITRHLVELHGGTLEVRSEGRGKGATFVVRFPSVSPLLSLESTARERTAPQAASALPRPMARQTSGTSRVTDALPV